MTALVRSERLLYELPTALANSEDASPNTMRDALEDDVAQLVEHHEGETDLVAVQGPISSMKTWFLTCAAGAFLDRGCRVVALVPQRVNRRDLIGRLETFGVPYVEHPGRADLCTWESWLETVGRVDERTCSTNGCRLYPEDRDEDLHRLAEQALSKHKLETGGPVQFDEETAKDLAGGLDKPVCPHYLLEAVAEIVPNSEAVRIATYAKAFEDIDADKRLAADVALLDEGHTVAADVGRATTTVDLPAIATALRSVYQTLEESADRQAQDAAQDIEPVELALEDWTEASRENTVNPRQIFAESPITLTDAFDALESANSAIMSKLRRAVRSGDQERVWRLGEIYGRLRDVTMFLSRVQSYVEGDLDFVHTRYEVRGETTNETEFRRVATRDPASTPREVYQAWCEEGTHPAITARWGDLLDSHIEAVWSGRNVLPGGDHAIPGAPPSPLTQLHSTTGSGTLVGYSATHNEASDPARPHGDLRRTAHRLAVAPLQLRSEGDERTDYHGQTTVDPTTPWFCELVRQVRNETDAQIAAVPINGKNADKWETMPVETLELPDGRGGTSFVPGLVPHTRGAIGDKGLEDLPIDAVLCGVQVQGPADTARRLVELWELLAPDHEDPTAALERSWRLLAQHALSGTIQAAGRFRPEATNIVFERPELVELAGFEYELLSQSMGGFAGEFTRAFGKLKADYERRRDAIRATRVVEYLERTPSNSPTRNQYLSKYREMYDATEQEATRAFEAAVESKKVEYSGGMLRAVSDGEAVRSTDG